jgi:selenocysteine-specific elongation factor
VPADQPLTLGTAGHIDHGKTALVAALTGVDTDRLPQEKARGISIELGYAPLELPSGRRLSVVDVPGHERFVRTMVAGATGIDLFLLVVAADDGVMPQTREHLAIVELLDVPAGAVALTKRDLVDDELAELARLGVEELLDEGPYAGSQVVEVSSRTGSGLDGLRAALDGLATGAGRGAGEGPVRLPIDRVFTLRGIGTVVTGTLWSGTVAVGDRLAIEPGGREARVRSVQVHDRAVERAEAGQRVALALVGVERAQIRRGHTAATPGALPRSFRLECRLRVLGSAARPLRHGDLVTAHHGTAETPATVVLPDVPELRPGAEGDVQLRLRRQISAAAGDRVILRLTSPQVTVAGGTVTDPAPPRSRRPAPAPQAAPQPAPERPAVPEAALAELRDRLAAAPLQPPSLGPGDAAAIAALVEGGQAVRAGRDLAFTAEAFATARDAAVEIATAGGSVTLAQLRDRLGISRKFAQALLEAMDANGVTRRVGDERVLRRRARD